MTVESTEAGRPGGEPESSRVRSASLAPDWPFGPTRPDARSFHIAVLPGDGIGPEVLHEAVELIQALEPRLEGVRFRLDFLDVGAAQYRKSGNPLPDAAFEACRGADAILLGAMGLPDVRWPTGVEMAPQVDLRERLDLFCGLRPLKLYNAADSPLRPEAAGRIDLLLVRENTEGLFSSRLDPRDAGADEVSDRLRVTRRGAERVCRAAFVEARKRRRHVTLVDKANILPSMAFLRRVFDEVAAEFPDVKTDRVYVDAAALFLVRRPWSFDVIVTENMFGDILSDLGAGLVGGMGMAPSADIGDSCAVFQPAHGSAPDIAGQGVANPIATLLSTAMMFDWLGHPETVRAARAVERAVEVVMAEAGLRTRDMGGRLATQQMGALVREATLAALDSVGAVDGHQAAAPLERASR